MVDGVGTRLSDRQLDTVDPFPVRSRLLCPNPDERANGRERAEVCGEGLLGENLTVGVTQSVLAYHLFTGCATEAGGRDKHVWVGISRPPLDRRMPFLRVLGGCPHISRFLHPE